MSDTREQVFESVIQQKGLTAPRITPYDIDAAIASKHFFTAAEGVHGAYFANNMVYVGDMPNDVNTVSLPLLTICVLVLRNGFTVTGESACASPENFNRQIGQQIAYQNARDKIWPLLGFQLRCVLFQEVTAPHPPTALRK